jgi:hypothetical protein
MSIRDWWDDVQDGKASIERPLWFFLAGFITALLVALLVTR